MTASPSGLMPQLIILIGAPGAGKTLWAEAFASASPMVKWTILSAESFYSATSDSQRAHRQFLSAIDHGLSQHTHLIIDGSFLYEEDRAHVLRLAKKSRYLVKDAVVFSVEPEVAIKRYIASEQQRLTRGLPSFHFSEEEIRRSVALLQCFPVSLTEGFTSLYDAYSGGVRKPQYGRSTGTDILPMSSPTLASDEDD